MKTTLVRCSALAALLAVSLAANARAAAPAEGASLLALPAPFALTAAPVAPAPELAVEQFGLPEVQLAGVHYRPRTSGQWGRHVDALNVTQIHLGFFDPEGDPGREFLLGARFGPMVDPHVQIGLAADWSHLHDDVSAVSHQSTGPNGTTITVKEDLSSASTDLFPLMAFVQLQADDAMGVIPYFGLGGGYEWMTLHADNFQTNASFDATYGGWGWQIWGGAAIPLSGQARVTGEVYVNTAELGRDVTDELLGGTYRETVKANGVGVRAGIAWGF